MRCRECGREYGWGAPEHRNPYELIGDPPRHAQDPDDHDRSPDRFRSPVRKATGKRKKEIVREQGRWAKREGVLVGKMCPEQMGTQPDCATCRWCLKQSTKSRPRDVTFALH